MRWGNRKGDIYIWMSVGLIGQCASQLIASFANESGDMAEKDPVGEKLKTNLILSIKGRLVIWAKITYRL